MKKQYLTIAVVLIIALGAGVFAWQKQGGKRNIQEQPKDIVDTSADEQKQFVTDVDPDVSHWQTKETEFFTIKFPKEWYWVESIITNNPEFDSVKYSDIGIFSDIGPNSYPLTLSNATEVVMSHRGYPTSNAGTPQDSVDAIFKLAKYNNPSVDCKVTNNKVTPFTAYCTAMYDMQLQRSYYVINDKISLTFTVRTTRDAIVKNEVLDKIAGSIILK